MKVLVIGATGFIGLPVAQAFVRAGHIVYGQTRSQDKARQLAAEEIIPVVGPVNEPHKWLHHIATLDTVIVAVGGSEITTLYPLLLTAVEEAATKYRQQGTPRITFIQISGTWGYGDDRRNIKSDTSPTNPPELVAWQPAFEQQVLNSKLLNSVVIRAALLYGRSGSLLEPLFKGASEGKVVWYGKPHGRWAVIHCDDLADLFVRAAEQSALVGGKIFVAANDITESVDDALDRLVEVSGAQGPPVYQEPSNPYEIALTTTTLMRPYLARALLGWQPRKPGFVDNLEVYYNAWKASAGL